MKIEYRRARKEHHEWAYRLFRESMKDYIEATWGWDEIFQRHGFMENIQQSGFTIARLRDDDIGGYCLKDRGRFLHLDILLIDPRWQNCGLGTMVMQDLIEQSRASGRPLQLDVLKTNAGALRLYRRLGFTTFDEDQARHRLRWLSNNR
ncbi:MAG: GNAT family N-acetyltransferase [Pseudohongiellaceae bacterium]